MHIDTNSSLSSDPTTFNQQELLAQATPAMLNAGDGRSVGPNYIPLREIKRQGEVPLSSQLFIAGATVWAWTGGPVPLDLNVGEAMFLGFSAVGTGVLVLEQMRTSEADRTRYYLQRQDGSRVELDPQTTYVAPVSNIPISQPVASPAQSILSAQTSSSYTPVYGPPTIPFGNTGVGEIATNGMQTIRDAAARPIPTTLSSANPTQISAEGQAVLARMQMAEQWLNEQILAATSGDSPQSKPEPKGEEESPPPVVEKPSEDGLPGLDTTPAGPLVPAGEQGQTGAKTPKLASGEGASSSPTRSGSATGGRISGGEFPSPTPGGGRIDPKLVVALTAVLSAGIHRGAHWILNQLQQQDISVPDPVAQQLHHLEKRWRDYNRPPHWEFGVDPTTIQMQVTFDEEKMTDAARQQLRIFEGKFDSEIIDELINAAINGGFRAVYNVVLQEGLIGRFTYYDLGRIHFMLGNLITLNLFHDAFDHGAQDYIGIAVAQEHINFDAGSSSVFITYSSDEKPIRTLDEIITAQKLLIEIREDIDSAYLNMFSGVDGYYQVPFRLFFKEVTNIMNADTPRVFYMNLLAEQGYLAHLNPTQMQQINTILDGTDGVDFNALMASAGPIYSDSNEVTDWLLQSYMTYTLNILSAAPNRDELANAISSLIQTNDNSVSSLEIADLFIMFLRMERIIAQGIQDQIPTKEEFTRRLLQQLVLYSAVSEQLNIPLNDVSKVGEMFKRNSSADNLYLPADLLQQYDKLRTAFDQAAQANASP